MHTYCIHPLLHSSDVKVLHFWITMYIQRTHSHSVKLSLNLAGYSERACKPWLFYLAGVQIHKLWKTTVEFFFLFLFFYQLSRFQKGQIIHLTPPHFFLTIFFKSETFKDCRNPGLVSWKWTTLLPLQLVDLCRWSIMQC